MNIDKAQTLDGKFVMEPSVVNALSEHLTVQVKNKGQIHQHEYRRGTPQYDVKVIGETEETGTTVKFQPDPEIFKETVEYDFDMGRELDYSIQHQRGSANYVSTLVKQPC